MAGLILKYQLVLRRQNKVASAIVQIRNYSQEIKILKYPSIASLPRGAGGRSSFNGKVCTVFGSTGFIGKYIVCALAKIGTQLILPHRGNNYDAKRLKVAGDLGQIIFLPFDLRDEESIRNSVKYSNVVINLIGRNWETKNFTFKDVNVDGPARIARICRESGVERLIHFSNLNARLQPTPILIKEGSNVLKSKFYGEQAVKREFPEATIIRPSVMFGTGDQFLSSYCSLWRRHFNRIPLYKKGEQTVKMPIHGQDVASGIVQCVQRSETAGETYQFVGEQSFKLSNLIQWLIVKSDQYYDESNHLIMDYNNALLYKLQLKLLEMVPGAPIDNLSLETYEMEHISDCILPEYPLLEDLGVKQETFDRIAGWELGPYLVDAEFRYYSRFNPPIPPPVPLNSCNL